MRWLLSYSALLGPLGGVLIADFHIVRRRQLVVQDLFTLQPQGRYHYQRVRPALSCLPDTLPDGTGNNAADPRCMQ